MEITVHGRQMLAPLCGDSTAPSLSLTKCALGMSTLNGAFTFSFLCCGGGLMVEYFYICPLSVRSPCLLCPACHYWTYRDTLRAHHSHVGHSP